MQPGIAYRSGPRIFTGFAVALAAVLLFGCASGQPAAPVEKPAEPVNAFDPVPAAPKVRAYLPLESVSLVELTDRGNPEGGQNEKIVELRFDRPGHWSIDPERFEVTSGTSHTLVPIQTFGEEGLTESTLTVLRFVPERPAGYLAGYHGEDFLTQQLEPLEVPDAVVLVDNELVSKPLLLAAPPDSPLFRRGIGSLEELRRLLPDSATGLSSTAEAGINLILELGSAGGTRRGFRDILFVPRDPLKLRPYPSGLELELTIPENLDTPASPLEWLKLELNPRKSVANPFPDVRIGDLGLFSGATPLLNPGLTEVGRELYRSVRLVRIGEPGLVNPSPILMTGSFNAYRDERRRFLFYPAIFSYIPGMHPDMSAADVEKISGYRPADLDALLSGRSVVTLRRDIYGAIPAFIAASESPTELEIAFRRNPRLREQLREFLNEPAYVLWLD